MSILKADQDRLWASLMAMAAIGATVGGGSNRLALSAEDGAARDLLRGWCEAAGLTVTVDGLGSMFARRAGSDPWAPPVLLGSHLDTQPLGGRFDGVLGVLAALEAVRTLTDRDITTRAPIEIVNWSDEEGARFLPAMMASSVFAGAYRADTLLAACDADGVSYGAALERIGYRGPAPIGGRKIGAYLELHIEQGPVLEGEGKTIGIVTAVQGFRALEVTVTGQSAHAGTTPMDRRKDALAAATSLLGRLYAIGHGTPDLRLTIGAIKLAPGSPSAIPGKAWFTIDMRHPSEAVLDQMRARIDWAVAATLEQHDSCRIAIGGETATPAIKFDPWLLAAIRAAADGLSLPHRDMPSGAIHDAVFMATIAPAAMIFVPSRDGLSHNEEEYSSPEDCAAGASVLMNAAIAAANR